MPSCMRALSSRSVSDRRGSISKRASSSATSARTSLGAHRRGGAHEVARRDRVDLRAEDAHQRVHVDADVAHAVHRVAEHADLQRAPARDGRGGGGPAPDLLAEGVAAPVLGDDVELAPGAHHRIRGVLRAVDALVVGQVGHVPRGRDLAGRAGCSPGRSAARCAPADARPAWPARRSASPRAGRRGRRRRTRASPRSASSRSLTGGPTWTSATSTSASAISRA